MTATIALFEPGDWAMTFMKGFAIFVLSQYILSLTSPREMAALWKTPDVGNDPKALALSKHVNHWGLMSFLCQLLVLYGSCTAPQLVGYTFLVPLKLFFELWFVTKDVSMIPLSKEKYAFWLLLVVIGTWTLLL